MVPSRGPRHPGCPGLRRRPPSSWGAYRLVVFAAVVALAGAALAHAQAAGASRAFAVLSSATPHVLVSGSDASMVPVTLRNDGAEVWDSSRGFALSYHWRTLFDRMVQRDGTRSPLPNPVEPGQTVTFNAELGLPPGAGVYVLQWDMVQEGVSWFSNDAPPPHASTIVVVLPGAGAALAALSGLPAVLAALGLLFLVRVERHAPGRDGLAPRRGPVTRLAARVLPAWDLAWCAVSLFVKQVALLSATELHLTAGGAAASALISAGTALLLYAAVRRAWRPRVAWLVVAFGSLVLLADVVYYRFFGDVLSAAALSATGQVGHLTGSVVSLLRPEDAWLGLDLVIAWPLVGRLGAWGARDATWRGRAIAACTLAGALLIAAPTPLGQMLRLNSDDEIFRHLNLVERVGIFAYHLDDGLRYARRLALHPAPPKEAVAEARAWFAEQAPQRAGVGPRFGAARGRNLVVLLVESLQGFVVGLKVNGQEVTPNLNRLRAESVWSRQVVDQVAEGRTSDAELMNSVSLLPLPHGAAAFQYPGNHFVSLPAILAGRGYATFSAVPFDAGFWNRRVTHAAYGFSRSFFAPDFQPGEQVGWGLNDRSFLRQMVPRLQAMPRPFCALMITLSLHHPFDSFPDSLKSMNLGRWNGTRLGNYLHAMHLFDEGLGDLLAGLRANGVLDDTMLVVEGDHEAGVPWEQVAAVAGFRPDTLDWYAADRVPLLIRVPGDRAPRGELATVAGQADVAPTLLALLGIDPAPLPFVGRNLLGAPKDVPVVRRYGDWFDSRHLYLGGQGYSSRKACFDLAGHHEVGLEECAAGEALAARQLRVSNRVLTSGLQQSLMAAAPIAGSPRRRN